MPKYSKLPKNRAVTWEAAPDIKKRVIKIVSSLDLGWINLQSVHFLRSYHSKTRAYARIWGLGRIWQMVLNNQPTYILEVIAEKYDRLSFRQQEEVLIHELAHIPKNFSGSLVPHYRRGKRKFKDKIIRMKLINKK